MFGFLRPDCRSTHFRQYRQVYAAFCAFHRKRYGLLASAMLSYEAIFMYQLGIAAGACSAPSSSTPRCCKLRSDPNNLWNVNANLAAYCSDFGMLLAGVKIEDDVRDHQSLVGRVVSRAATVALKHGWLKAKSRIESATPGMIGAVEEQVQAHLKFETSKQRIELKEYSDPTAKSFELLFRGFADVCSRQAAMSVDQVDAFGMIGSNIGRSLLTADCFFDLKRDRKSGEFNPIQNHDDEERAVEIALQSLSRAGWVCESLALSVSGRGQSSGLNRVAEGVLADVFERIEKRKRTWNRLCQNSDRQTDSKLSENHVPVRSGVARNRLALRRGFCDGDCIGGCLCEGCDGGGGCEFCDGGDDPGVCPSCCGPCELCPFDDCGSSKKQDDAKIVAAEIDDGIVVMGTAVGPLNPMGVVQIADVEHPAKSEGNFIEDGATVMVVGKTGFGLIVRRIDE